MNTTATPEFATLREKIAWEKAERLNRYAAYNELFQNARAAGLLAGQEVQIAPSIVGTAIGLSDEIDTTKPVYLDTAGPCGFAWVEVRPATCSFARWLVKMGLGSKAYGGGIRIRISEHGQSVDRKEAHARTMAGVLQASPLLDGVRIYAASRMD